MPGKTENSLDQVSNGIDQIREILVGEKITEFETQIEELQQQTALLKQNLNSLTKNYNETVQLVAEHMQQLQQSEKTHTQTNAIIEGLRKELGEKIDELTENKVDKSQIGQAFIDWGIKVKETAKK